MAKGDRFWRNFRMPPPSGNANMSGAEDPHQALHLYAGDSALVIRDNGDKTLHGVQLPELLALFGEPKAGWQPIETSPKDGEMVLLARNGERYAARWTQGEVHGPCWCTPDGYVIYRAAAWHPLPPAPTEIVP